MSKDGRSDLSDGHYILFGQVGRAFGIKGEIRVHPYNPLTETVETLKYLFLRSNSGETRKHEIEQIRPHQNCYVIRLKEISDRDQSEAVLGFKVLLEKDQLPLCKKGEFYWFDLIGLKVVLENGQGVGELVRLEETNSGLGGNEVLVVKSDGVEVLVPFTKDEVRKIDLKAGEIMIRSLEDFKL